MRFDQIPMLSGARGVRGHSDEFKSDRLNFLKRATAEHPLTRMKFFGRTILIVGDPGAAHEVLVEKARMFRKSPATRMVLYPLAGEGLFTSGGELWKRQRKLMAPMFHHAQIAGFAECMTTCAHRTVDRLTPGSITDVTRATTQIAMSVVGKALFDAETFDDADQLGEALTTALAWSDSLTGGWPLVSQLMLQATVRGARAHTSGRARDALGRVLDRLEVPLTYYLPRSKQMREAISLIDGRIARMIADRRAIGLSREDMLTQLLRAHDEDDGEHMTDKQVRDEAVTLFVAGHETTAISLAWAFYELSRHPEMYAKVQREGDALAGRTPRMEDLPQLSYSLKVFKEALRKYPPVYITARQAAEATEVAGYDIPKDTLVMVSPYGIHHNPAVYPDPDRFDPERFEPSEEAKRHRSAWLPFGGGPRICIGNHFALLEGQIVLATVSRRVTFSVPGNRVIEPEPQATLRSSEMQMTVHARATERTEQAAAAS